MGHFEQLYKRFSQKIFAAKTRVGEQSFRNHHFHLWRFSADQRYSIEHAFTETLKCFRSQSRALAPLKVPCKTTEDIAEYADFRRNSDRYPGVSVRNVEIVFVPTGHYFFREYEQGNSMYVVEKGGLGH